VSQLLEAILALEAVDEAEPMVERALRGGIKGEELGGASADMVMPSRRRKMQNNRMNSIV
jgi:hypothetical protein